MRLGLTILALGLVRGYVHPPAHLNVHTQSSATTRTTSIVAQDIQTRNRLLAEATALAKNEREMREALKAKQEAAANARREANTGDIDVTLAAEHILEIMDEDAATRVDFSDLPVYEHMWEDLERFDEKRGEFGAQLDAITAVPVEFDAQLETIAEAAALAVDWDSAADALVDQTADDEMAASFERRAQLRAEARAASHGTPASAGADVAPSSTTDWLTASPSAIDLEAVASLAGPVLEKVGILVRDATVATVALAVCRVRDEVGQTAERVHDDVREARDYVVDTPARVRREVEALADEITTVPQRLLEHVGEELNGLRDRIVAAPSELSSAAEATSAELVHDANALPEAAMERARREVDTVRQYPAKLTAWVEERTGHVMRTEVATARAKLDAAKARKARMQAQLISHREDVARRIPLPSFIDAPRAPPPPTETLPTLHSMLTRAGSGRSWWKEPEAVKKTGVAHFVPAWFAPADEPKPPETILTRLLPKALPPPTDAMPKLHELFTRASSGQMWFAPPEEVKPPESLYTLLATGRLLWAQPEEEVKPPVHFLARVGSGRSWWKE